MVSPIVKAYHNLIGDTPTAATPASPAVQPAVGTRGAVSAAGPSFLSGAAAASTSNLAGGKSLLGQ